MTWNVANMKWIMLVSPVVLTVAGLSKLAFLTLLMTLGRPFLDDAAIAIFSDVIQVALFIGYLVAARRVEQVAGRAGG